MCLPGQLGEHAGGVGPIPRLAVDGLADCDNGVRREDGTVVKGRSDRTGLEPRDPKGVEGWRLAGEWRLVDTRSDRVEDEPETAKKLEPPR
jgi:hypothetical protein